jgi:tetraacyldisaccharide 4'-kinase
VPAATHGGWQRLAQAWGSRGPLARALLPVAVLYGSVVASRRWLYCAGWLRARRVAVPVIVVGNLIAGGAGKTPTVMAVVAALRAQGRHPGVISRGYGRSGGGLVHVAKDISPSACGDEPLLLHLRLGVPVAVASDRVAAANALLSRHPEVDVIVSDDGLQHLRLARDAQVLVFDERGAGNGWLLPAGPLREPLPGRVPPHSLVLYNAARASTALPGHTARRQLAGAVSLEDWWTGAKASAEALQQLQGRPLIAAAGMAHPGRFFDMLRGAGLSIETLALPDHFDFASLPWPGDAGDVIVTEKDAVKLRPDRLGNTRVWVAPLDFRLDANFEQALLALLPPLTTRTNDGHPTA